MGNQPPQQQQADFTTLVNGCSNGKGVTTTAAAQQQQQNDFSQLVAPSSNCSSCSGGVPPASQAQAGFSQVVAPQGPQAEFSSQMPTPAQPPAGWQLPPQQNTFFGLQSAQPQQQAQGLDFTSLG